MLWRLYYDGGCRLCSKNRLRAERWAEASEQPLEAIPLQAEQGFGMRDLVLVADREYRGADAWLVLCGIGPWYLKWLPPLRFFPPTRWAAALIYRIVAATRYRLFGRTECDLPRKSV